MEKSQSNFFSFLCTLSPYQHFIKICIFSSLQCFIKEDQLLIVDNVFPDGPVQQNNEAHSQHETFCPILHVDFINILLV